MADLTRWLLLGFLHFNITKSQELLSGDESIECSRIIKNCQTQCSSFPGNYVRWIVDMDQRTLSCQLHELKVALPENTNNPLISIYDVPCCADEAHQQQPVNHFCEDDKVDTLIVLGVGTLLSILMMCGFALIGLIMFHRKKQTYRTRVKNLQIRKHSFTEESRRSVNSTPSRTVTEFSPDHKGKCLKSKKEETSKKDNYIPVRKQPSGESCSDKDKTLTAKERLEYVNQEAYDHNNLSSSRVKDDVMAQTSAEKIASRVEIGNNYEKHGGFVTPRSSCYQEESNYIRYPDFQTNSINDSATKITALSQIPAVKSKSKDVVEDPYVQAPPLKSSRSQPKPEKPHAYQTLIPNGPSPKDESDDYNMLVHNSAIPSQDAKAFFLLNNNLKSSGINANNKCKVTLKPHGPSQPSSQITINEINC